MEAAEAYHEDGLEIELLVEAGGDVNERDHDGHTPLYYAFQNGSISQFSIVSALLQRGAHGNSSPCGLLDNMLGPLEGEEDFFDDDDVEYGEVSHRLHILLLRATLPVILGTPSSYNTLASSCLAVHQAHFRYARAVFVAARNSIQLVRAHFGGVDSPIALALITACSAEERATARAAPMQALHRPRFPVHLEHIQSKAALQEHSKNCEPVLNIEEAAGRVARFALDLKKSTALPANQRNQCGLNTALWYAYLNIPITIDDN